jgi:hypothetical protein
MAKESEAQTVTIKRVMHEAKTGALKTAAGQQMTSRKQVIAIALQEAGASNQETPAQNRKNLRKTKRREAGST